jgi:uncharacterized protein (TIGR00730 family)
MNICIFCSANDLDEKYTGPAKELATLLAEAGHTLVWGGSNNGLMKIMADGVQQEGGKIIGVSLELLKQHARKDADEMIIAKDLGERKAILLERSDIIIMLVGGLGTLDETTEILELKKHGVHNKAVIILNTAGFYDGLKIQLQRMADEGFLPVKERGHIKVRTLSQLVQFADTPDEAMGFVGGEHNGKPSTEVPPNRKS